MSYLKSVLITAFSLINGSKIIHKIKQYINNTDIIYYVILQKKWWNLCCLHTCTCFDNNITVNTYDTAIHGLKLL